VEVTPTTKTDDDPFVPSKSSTSLGASGSSSTTAESSPSKTKGKAKDIVTERTDELTGLIVGFGYALQYVPLSLRMLS